MQTFFLTDKRTVSPLWIALLTVLAVIGGVSSAAHATQELGTVTGEVNNGTAGEALPADLVVTLHVLQSGVEELTLDSIVAHDGMFIFSDVPINPAREFQVTTIYNNRIFASEVITTDAISTLINLPLTIYELTDDPVAIVITSLVTQVTGLQDRIQVAEVVTYRNTSDRLFSGGEIEAARRFTSVIVPIAKGARIVDTASDPQRYMLSSDTTALIDSQPLLPGEDHFVHIIYDLEYDGSIDIRLPYKLDGLVRLLAETETLNASTEQLTESGAQLMGGAIFATYQAALSLEPGEYLHFGVTLTSVDDPIALGLSPSLAATLLITLGGLTLVGAAILFYVVRRHPSSPDATQGLRDFIIEQIAELDTLHEQNKIDSAAYKTQRSQLKRRLGKTMLRK